MLWLVAGPSGAGLALRSSPGQASPALSEKKRIKARGARKSVHPDGAPDGRRYRR